MTVQNSTELTATASRLRIISIALVAGVVLFAAVAWFIVADEAEPAKTGFISFVAAGVAVLQFILHLVVPGIMAQAAVRAAGNPSEPQLLQIYQTKTIIRLALLEGAALFCVATYMIEHQIWTLGIAAALVVFMFASIPTKTRIAHWVETQRAVT